MIYTISKNVQIYENYVNNQSFSVDFFFNKRLWAVGSRQSAVNRERWAENRGGKGRLFEKSKKTVSKVW